MANEWRARDAKSLSDLNWQDFVVFLIYQSNFCDYYQYRVLPVHKKMQSSFCLSPKIAIWWRDIALFLKWYMYRPCKAWRDLALFFCRRLPGPGVCNTLSCQGYGFPLRGQLHYRRHLFYFHDFLRRSCRKQGMDSWANGLFFGGGFFFPTNIIIFSWVFHKREQSSFSHTASAGPLPKISDLIHVTPPSNCYFWWKATLCAKMMKF